MHYPYNKALTPVAQKLRNQTTPEENKLWYQYLSKLSVRFLRQKVIENYILDFYCSKCKLGIEIDGDYHNIKEFEAYDKARTELLNLYNITILRFTNNQIKYEFESVCKQIEQHIIELYGAKFSESQ